MFGDSQNLPCTMGCSQRWCWALETGIPDVMWCDVLALCRWDCDAWAGAEEDMEPVTTGGKGDVLKYWALVSVTHKDYRPFWAFSPASVLVGLSSIPLWPAVLIEVGLWWEDVGKVPKKQSLAVFSGTRALGWLEPAACAIFGIYDPVSCWLSLFFAM